MRIRILLQVGAMHKPEADPDQDFLKLFKGPNSVFDWAMDNINLDFRHKETHKLADGTPFLMEFESITDLPTC